MGISMRCPECGRKLTAPDSAAGKRARCPHCKTVVTLPQVEALPETEDVLDAEPVQADAVQSPDPIGITPPPLPPPPAPGSEGRKFYPPPPLPMGDDIPLAPEAPSPAEAGPPRRPCPMCGELIPVNAVQCRFCKEIFDPTLKKAQQKRQTYDPADEDMTGGEWVLAILCSGIGCILGIVWMIQGKPKGKKMFGFSLLFAIIWSVIRGILENMNTR